MKNKAFFNSPERVLSWYESNGGHFYSIWEGRKMRMSCTDADADKAKSMLSQFMDDCIEGEHNDVFEIRLHPKKAAAGFYTEKSEYSHSTTFRVCEYQPAPYGYPVQYMPQQQNNAALNEIKEQLNAISSRMAALETDDDDNDDQPENVGGIGALLNNPQIQEKLINGLVALIAPPGKPTALSGFTKNQKVSEALDILYANGLTDNDVMLLANMAVNDKAQFSMLLTMLRK